MDCMTELVPEDARLQRLNEIQAPFKNEGDEPFDSMVKLVRDIFGVPIVVVSLVYEDIQWFKAGVGLTINQTPRSESFCAWTLLPTHPEVLYIPNATHDERFKSNPLVTGDFHIEFYCGTPIVTSDSVRLGALCIMDRHPRSLRPNEIQILRNLAELTAREMVKTEVGKQLHKRLSAEQVVSTGRLPSLSKALVKRQLWFEEGLTEGVLVVDIRTSDWPVVWANPYWTDLGGVPPGWRQSLWSLVQPMDMEIGAPMRDMLLEQLRSNDVEASFTARLVPLESDEDEASKIISCSLCLAERPICKAARFIHMPTVTPTAYELESTTAFDLRDERFAVLIIRLSNDMEVASEGMEVETSAQVRPEASSTTAASCQRASIEQTFRRYDEDGKGDISLEKLEALLEKLSPNLDKEMVERLLCFSGLNRDGRIDYADLLGWLFEGKP